MDLLCLFPYESRHERSIDSDKQEERTLHEPLDILGMLEVRRHVICPPSLGDRIQKFIDIGEM
jgi:hypothetical protein